MSIKTITQTKNVKTMAEKENLREVNKEKLKALQLTVDKLEKVYGKPVLEVFQHSLENLDERKHDISSRASAERI